MANIEHLMTIKVAPAKVYEALTTEKGLGEPSTWLKKMAIPSSP